MAEIIKCAFRFENDAAYAGLEGRLLYGQEPPPIPVIAEALGREDWGRLLELALARSGRCC
jgi:hypothetical protein